MHIMVLSDDETFTSLSGCKIISLADEFDDDELDICHYEEAIRAILTNDFGHFQEMAEEEGLVFPEKIGELVTVFD